MKLLNFSVCNRFNSHRSSRRVLLLSLAVLSLYSFYSNRVLANYDTKDAAWTVGIATGAGAVLGLSTVSFYSDPSNHFGNIWVGAGLGLIVGVGVAAYLAAAQDSEEEIDPEELLIDTKKKELKDDLEKKGKETLEKSKNSSFYRFKRSDNQSFEDKRLAPIVGSASMKNYQYNETKFALPLLLVRY